MVERYGLCPPFPLSVDRIVGSLVFPFCTLVVSDALLRVAVMSLLDVSRDVSGSVVGQFFVVCG